MLNRDFAGTTSQIANTTRITPVQQVDYASAVNNFLNQYRTSADRYAKEQEIAEQKQKTQNLVDALTGGDENAINKAYATYDPSGFLARQFAVKDKADDRSWQEKLNDIAYQRDLNKLNIAQKNAMDLAGYKNKLAQDTLSNNPYGKTSDGLALAIMSNPENYTPEQQAWASNRLAGNSVDMAYDKAKAGYQAKADVESQQNQIKEQQAIAQDNASIDNALALIDSAPDKLFTPYAGMQSIAGAVPVTSSLGFNEQENETYGQLERTIGDIKNNLIAKAKSKGQSGINTLPEIELASAGVTLGKGKSRLKGALSALKQIEKKLDAMDSVATPMPQTSSVNQSSNDIIDASEYF